MNRIMITATAIFLMIPIAGTAQSSQTASLVTPLSPNEVRDLIKSAHSVAEYKHLAGYFHQQETDYRAKAADEKVELDRRAQVNAGLYQKYPRPVDTAQGFYDSYVSSANSAALQARHFDELAAGTGQHQEQMAGQVQGRP